MNGFRAPAAYAGGWLALALALASPSAQADITKDQCVDANTRAQSLRREGKLGAAREQLALCLDVHCPGIVRDDCTQRLDELEHAQPTIVFDMKDAAGQDVVDVHVTIDGQRLTDRLNGRALGVDPGEHVFVFEVSDLPSATYRFVLKEGEKDRRERIVVASAPPVVAGATEPAGHGAPPKGQGQRVLGVVLAAAGLAGVGIGAVSGGIAFHDWSSSKTECNLSRCDDHPGAISDRAHALSAATVSTVGFLSGGVLLATGIAIWITSPPKGGDGAPAALALRIAPSIAPTGAGIAASGEF